MDAAAIAGLCALLARGNVHQALPAGVSCPPIAQVSQEAPSTAMSRALRAAVSGVDARDGIARVVFAEAGNQGDSGLAGVVYTILNRLQDGRWGSTIDAVLNARSQFEPVMRVGGDWRRLPEVSAAAQARIDTILNLAMDGRLPDLTGGARFFQNPVIVADRARAGQISPGLVNFGGAAPSAVIGAHSFYVEARRGGRAASARAVSPAPGEPARLDVLFVGENRAGPAPATPDAAPDARVPGDLDGDPSRRLFVAHDGRINAGQP
jgi:N-acetylmuramoyl-L-alanine amidase